MDSTWNERSRVINISWNNLHRFETPSKQRILYLHDIKKVCMQTFEKVCENRQTIAYKLIKVNVYIRHNIYISKVIIMIK